MFKKFFILLLIISFSLELKADKQEKSLVILDFSDTQGIFAEKPEILTLLIFSKITQKTDKIEILERGDLKTAIDEEYITTAKNTSSSISERKLPGAEFILEGKIYSLGNNIAVNAKLIDCKTGKINGISRSYNDSLPIDDILEKFSDSAADYIVKKLVPTQPQTEKIEK